MACMHSAVIALLALALMSGCSWVPKRQLTACQSQNRILNEQAQTQLAEIEKLKMHSRTVEDRLITAERELAQLGKSDAWLAERTSAENVKR